MATLFTFLFNVYLLEVTFAEFMPPAGVAGVDTGDDDEDDPKFPVSPVSTKVTRKQLTPVVDTWKSTGGTNATTDQGTF